MGLFGGGNSKKTTNNNDNRIINDYANAEFDNSVRNETDNSITGDYNGNTGVMNITEIDGGAFELVSESSASMAALSADGMALADSLTNSSLGFADGVFSDAAELVNEQSGRSLDAALAVHESSIEQLSIGSDLAFGLAQMNNDAGLEQQKQNNSSLTNGFKSMMQFADSFSRSDGASIADSNNKMVMFSVGAIGLGFIAKQYFK